LALRYFLSELDEEGELDAEGAAGAGVDAALDAEAGAASLLDEAEASLDDPDEEPESLLLSLPPDALAFAWL
jgi:hypothetical protein